MLRGATSLPVEVWTLLSHFLLWVCGVGLSPERGSETAEGDLLRRNVGFEGCEFLGSELPCPVRRLRGSSMLHFHCTGPTMLWQHVSKPAAAMTVTRTQKHHTGTLPSASSASKEGFWGSRLRSSLLLTKASSGIS